jgi:hypothetical protein
MEKALLPFMSDPYLVHVCNGVKTKKMNRGKTTTWKKEKTTDT